MLGGMATEQAARWPAWPLILEARHRAGLTQEQLARLARTSQPAIARYERAAAMPDLATLHRLIEACGMELRISLAEPSHQRASAEEAALERSVEDRLRSNDSFVQAANTLRSG